MRHDFRIRGLAFEVRPVSLGDAQFIVKLRNLEQRNRHLHPTSPDVAGQVKWLEAYFDREGEFYFVIERLVPRRNEGLVAVMNLQEQPRSAEWGRWVLVPGSLAAAESSLLVYKAAFDLLRLDEIFCLTSAQNAAVVSFHDSCGLQRRAVRKDYFELGGTRYDAIEHALTRDSWPAVESKLSGYAQRVAQRLARAAGK